MSVALFVLTCRSITTDVSLPFFPRPLYQAPKIALRALFTPSERAHPFRTLVSPRFRGIFAAEILRITYRTLVFEPLDTFLSRDGGLTLNNLSPDVRAALNFALLVVLYAGSTLLLCPLDVAKTRLSVLYPDVQSETESQETVNEPASTKTGVLVLVDDAEEEDDSSKQTAGKEDDEPLEDAILAISSKSYPPSSEGLPLRPYRYAYFMNY